MENVTDLIEEEVDLAEMKIKAPPIPVQIELINAKLELWETTIWDASLDVTIANITKDRQLQMIAKNRLGYALKAKTFLEGKLKELNKPVQ